MSIFVLFFGKMRQWFFFWGGQIGGGGGVDGEKHGGKKNFFCFFGRVMCGRYPTCFFFGVGGAEATKENSVLLFLDRGKC